MSTIPREVLKWIQSLELNHPIKNPKRDFANGYLIAQILERSKPYNKKLTIEMNGFYSGTGPAAKKNNWELLEKYFKKLSIPVGKNLIEWTSSGKTEACIMLLSILYRELTKYNQKHAIANYSTFDLIAHESPPKSLVREEFDFNINKPLIETETINNGQSGSHESNKKFSTTVLDNGDIVVLSKYIISTLMQWKDVPDLWFLKSNYQILLIQKYIFTKFNEVYKVDTKGFDNFLKSNENEIIRILMSSSSSDIFLVLDTFLIFLITADSKSLLFKTTTTLLSTIGHYLYIAFPSEESQSHIATFPRLLNTRKFPTVIYTLTSQRAWKKFPSLAKIIHTFIQSDEEPRVEMYISLKSYIFSIRQDESNSVNLNTGYIVLLSSLLHHVININGHPRLHTFYISEALTCLNSLRRNLTNSTDNVTIECMASIQILVTLSYEKVGNFEAVDLEIVRLTCGYAKDREENGLFLCCFQLICNLLLMNVEKLELFKFVETALMGLDGEWLVSGLEMLGNTLVQNPPLSKLFVSTMLELSDPYRIKLIKRIIPLINLPGLSPQLRYRLPFISDASLLQYSHKQVFWFEYGIAMGLLASSEFTAAHYDIFATILTKLYIDLPYENDDYTFTWKEICGKLLDRILTEITPETLSSAMLCIFVFNKFGVFDDKELLQKLLITYMFIHTSSKFTNQDKTAFVQLFNGSFSFEKCLSNSEIDKLLYAIMKNRNGKLIFNNEGMKKFKTTFSNISL